MKKLGFTLAEVLIALSIVGAVAAIAGPAISNIAPDRNKAIYLDYYNKISQINDILLSDPEFYYNEATVKNDGSVEYEQCIGLGCTAIATKPGYQFPPDNNNEPDFHKYQRLVARHLGLDIDTAKNIRINFTTNDNIEWYFTPTSEKLGEFTTISYRIDMRLPNGGKGCTYNNNNNPCLKPRWYIYNVDTYGHVTPGDPLSKAYVENPYKMNDKRKDYDRASAIATAEKEAAEAAKAE